VKLTQNQYEEDILKLIDDNIYNMHKEMDQLKLNTEKEIKTMKEEGYPHVAKSLEEDLMHEHDILKEQYEENRRKGVEKINLKYMKCLK